MAMSHNRAIHVPTKFICCDEANLAWFFIKISKMINHLKLQLRPLGPPSEIAVHIKLCACIKGECYSQNPRLRRIITCVCRISDPHNQFCHILKCPNTVTHLGFRFHPAGPNTPEAITMTLSFFRSD